MFMRTNKPGNAAMTNTNVAHPKVVHMSLKRLCTKRSERSNSLEAMDFSLLGSGDALATLPRGILLKTLEGFQDNRVCFRGLRERLLQRQRLPEW